LKIASLKRSTYYYIKNNLKKADKHLKTKELITEIYHKHKGRYGYRRIAVSMREEYKNVVNHKTVLRLMKELGIASKIRIKKYRSYNGSIGKIAPNVLEQDFKTTKLDEKWVTDITEFKVCNQKVYLSPLIDLHTREVISYKISRSPNLKFVMDMINDGIDGRKFDNLTVHTDQGWHYQHVQYRECLKEANIVQSMSRKGNCYDNALAENFFGHLKSEFFYLEKFDSVDEFICGLHEYMRYYNYDRLSLKIKGMTPIQYRHHSQVA